MSNILKKVFLFPTKWHRSIAIDVNMLKLTNAVNLFQKGNNQPQCKLIRESPVNSNTSLFEMEIINERLNKNASKELPKIVYDLNLTATKEGMQRLHNINSSCITHIYK